MKTTRKFRYPPGARYFELPEEIDPEKERREKRLWVDLRTGKTYLWDEKPFWVNTRLEESLDRKIPEGSLPSKK